MMSMIRRVGVLVPQGNTVHAREFEAIRPDDVAFYFSEFSYPAPGPDFCPDLVETMRAPALALRDGGAEALLIGCTAASMQCADLAGALERIIGAPVVTAASATREAIVALGLSRLAVATPYGEANNRVVRNFLEGSGVDVVALEGLALDRSPETWAAGQPTLTPDMVLGFACRVDVPEADGVYMPCTAMGSLAMIDRFEQARGKPAFSSVQAGYWAVLRRLGYEGRRAGFGRLIETWDFEPVAASA